MAPPWSIWGDRAPWFDPIVNVACLPAAAWQPLPHGGLPPLSPVLDSSSRPYRPGRAGAGPRDCGGLSRAAGPGLLPLHGAETVSPGDELTAAWLLASPSGAGMALGAPLPPLTGSLGDRRSGLTVARPLQPVFAGSGRFWGRWKEQPGRGDDPGFDWWTYPPSCPPPAHSLPRQPRGAS